MGGATIPAPGSRQGLPRPIGAPLSRLGVRLRLSSLLRGLGTTALILAAGAAMGMVADFAWDLARPATVGDLGRMAGQRFPGLDPDSASAAPAPVQTVRSGRGGRAGESRAGRGPHRRRRTSRTGIRHGSPDLIAALADQAARSCRTLQPARSVSWSRAVRRMAIGMSAAGLVAAPPAPPRSVRRACAAVPDALGRHRRVARVVISVKPGDQVVAAGWT